MTTAPVSTIGEASVAGPHRGGYNSAWTARKCVPLGAARHMLPFHSNVRVGYNGNEVDGKSVLDLMTLTPPEGTKVWIRIEGPDAVDAMHAVDQLMQTRPNDD